MKEHGLQALLMPTHHFLIAVDAYGLEGRGGRGEIGRGHEGGVLSNVSYVFPS